MDGNPANWEACIASPSRDYGRVTVALLLSSYFRHPTTLFITYRYSPHHMGTLHPMEAFFLSYSTPHAPRQFTALLVSLKIDSINNLKQAKIEKAK